MTLPHFINFKNRLQMSFLCALVFIMGYTIPNHFHLFPPQLLPLTEWDKLIPLMPWTIIVYTSEYLLFALAYFTFDDEMNLNKYIWAYFGVILVGMIFFILFPTTYPRADYPLPTDVNPFVLSIFNWLRSLDDPSNCFPSMHVACCYLTAFAFHSKNESRTKFWIYFIWATLIMLSTLPTKQHYLVDVFGGLILSATAYWYFFKKVKYISMSEYNSRFRTFFKNVEF